MPEQLAQAGLIKGKTIGMDSTLEANAAMKSIVRRWVAALISRRAREMVT